MALFFPVERAIHQHLHDLGGRGRHFTCENFPRGSVDGNVIAFLQGDATRGKRAPLIINFDPRRAADADLAHLPRDERSVRGDAAARSQNAFGCNHAAQVFRGSFDPGEHHFLTATSAPHRFFGAQHDVAGSRPRPGGQTAPDFLRRGDRFAIENRGKEMA